MTISTLIVPIVVILVLAYFFTRRAQKETGTKLYMDRKDPRKYWAQAAMALYQGERGDPGYWKAAEAQSLMKNGWSTANREELLSLINSYIEGECNVGFDKLRIIWLARLGCGAGWIDEESSWNYVFDAEAVLQNTYASWEQLRDACFEGRDEWYGGETPEREIKWANNNYAFALEKYLRAVPFK